MFAVEDELALAVGAFTVAGACRRILGDAVVSGLTPAGFGPSS
ncbi:hypothetical protein [Amycolatopsis thermophila]|uniref:Uncharacterized protein n=1 Tax=Amycolatopsis thermophila TaxID=206084 RepID=A0ABU0F5W6_9PSEU|nr:hypothetical protein [Amycolatopsis thermophila]MDQ0382980.1 hypothetical protein [Amycolatopsis thermophila]